MTAEEKLDLIHDIICDDWESARRRIYVELEEEAQRQSRSVPVTSEEIAILKAQGLVPAIKAYRMRTGLGLLASKLALENHRGDDPGKREP